VRDHRAAIAEWVTCHTAQHSFATHLHEDGHGNRTVQMLLGHVAVRTTMVYTQVSTAAPPESAARRMSSLLPAHCVLIWAFLAA
jgi:site-specific recombinase XerD